MTLAKAIVGDVVTRNRVFTASFVKGEEHTVQRVSECGKYIWVGGHRHKVPTKYFNLLRRSEAPFKVGDKVKYGSFVNTPLFTVSAIKVIRGEWCIMKAENRAQGFVSASEYKLATALPSKLPTLPTVPDLTDFSHSDNLLGAPTAKPNFTGAPPSANGEDCGRVVGDNPHGCGLVAKTEVRETQEQYTERTGYRKFKAGDEIIHKNGNREFEVLTVSSCGFKFQARNWVGRFGWMEMKDFQLKEAQLINRDIVAGLILQGVDIQYRNLGEWFDVQPNTLTVAMIGRLDFRTKPLVMDYYGNNIPSPIDVEKTKVKTVWGISLNNNKIYPCALGTARVNKMKGHGMYWETESQAQVVFDVLMKPFQGDSK